MIKMSLIAAVAVTGLTSTVSAQPLEDAIKGVDFSGNLRYRYTNGEATSTDLLAGTTIGIETFVATLEKAIANAVEVK